MPPPESSNTSNAAPIGTKNAKSFYGASRKRSGHQASTSRTYGSQSPTPSSSLYKVSLDASSEKRRKDNDLGRTENEKSLHRGALSTRQLHEQPKSRTALFKAPDRLLNARGLPPGSKSYLDFNEQIQLSRKDSFSGGNHKALTNLKLGSNRQFKAGKSPPKPRNNFDMSETPVKTSSKQISAQLVDIHEVESSTISPNCRNNSKSPQTTLAPVFGGSANKKTYSSPNFGLRESPIVTDPLPKSSFESKQEFGDEVIDCVPESPPPPSSSCQNGWATDSQLETSEQLESEVQEVDERDRVIEARDPMQPLPLNNLGNTCYMNSVLQAIFALQRPMPVLNNQFRKFRKQSSQKMVLALLRINYYYTRCRNIRYGESPDVLDEHLRTFKQVVGRYNSQFATKRQQDAVEFFQLILEKIETEFTESKELPPEENAVRKLFEIEVGSQLTCNSCKDVLQLPSTISNTLYLSIPETSDEIHLQAAVDKHFLLSEPMEHDCKCGSKEKTSSSYLKKLPEVVFIQIGRYMDSGSKNYSLLRPSITITFKKCASKPSKGPNTSFGSRELRSPMKSYNSNAENSPCLSPISATRTRSRSPLSSMGSRKRSPSRSSHHSNSSQKSMRTKSPSTERNDRTPQRATSADSKNSAGSHHGRSSTETGEIRGLQEKDENLILEGTKSLRVSTRDEMLDENVSSPSGSDKENVSMSSVHSDKSHSPSELDIQAKYALKAIVCHSGSSLSGGHYFSYVVDPSGRWFKCDDECVNGRDFETLCESSSVRKMGYCYFYEKIEAAT